MQIKTSLKLLALCLVPTQATADSTIAPDVLQIPLASKHFGSWSDKDFNEINPGAIFTWVERAGDLNYSLGVYKDSKSAAALHVSVAKMWDIAEHTQAGIVGAYIHSSGDGFTGFAPSVQLNYKHLFVNVATGYDDDGIYGVVGTGLTIPLGK